jgi:hypothetical protein
MLRVISFLLALYLVVISFAPCSDNHVLSEHEKDAVATTHSPCDNESDACSPFCICSCCQGFMMITFGLKNISSGFSKDISFSSFLIGKPTAEFTDFWRPPQLS